VVGLISNNDETHYRREVNQLATCCIDQHPHPLTIGGAAVEQVSNTKFLGVNITEDLSWSNNTTSITKKAQQRLYFVRKLKRCLTPITPGPLQHPPHPQSTQHCG